MVLTTFSRKTVLSLMLLLLLLMITTSSKVAALTVTKFVDDVDEADEEDGEDDEEEEEEEEGGLIDLTLPPQNIVDGDTAAIEDFPWQVVVYQRLNFQSSTGRLLRQIITAEDFSLTQVCAGSIISPKLVITAQSCVPSLGSEYEFWIASGVSDLTQVTLDYPNLRKVARVIRYPRYFSENYGKNIALLILEQPIQFDSKQQAIDILEPAKSSKLESVGANVIITGWGAQVNKGPFSTVLRYAKVKVTSDVKLRQQAGKLTKDQIAAGDFPGRGVKDSCDGDVGGSMTGLQAGKRVLVGVTSWGVTCQSGIYPWVYNKVSGYARWIDRIAAANELPIKTMTLTLIGSGPIVNGDLKTFPVIVPRNLKAVHFEMIGTGDVQLSVRFLKKIGLPDCVAGEDWRCSFFYPIEGVYTAYVKGMPINGGYVKLNMVYEMFDNDGTTEEVTVRYSNNAMTPGETNDWSGFPVIPNTPFSFAIISKNPQQPSSVKKSARKQRTQEDGPVLFGIVTSPRVTIGNAVSDTAPPLCPNGDIGSAEEAVVTNCTRLVPKTATAMSIRIQGDAEFNTLYDLYVTFTRVKGASNTQVVNFPVVRLFDKLEKVFHVGGLNPGTEFGIRVHLFSGGSTLDVSIFFGDRSQIVQAHDEAVVGQTLFLSTIVPQYSQTAIIVFIGTNCKFSFVALKG